MQRGAPLGARGLLQRGGPLERETSCNEEAPWSEGPLAEWRPPRSEEPYAARDLLQRRGIWQ